MAKIAENTQVKGRKTKLSKKSSEELIEIILRKDKTERNLNNQVKNLKGEVNALTSRVNNFEKDQEGNVNEIKRLRETVKTKSEILDSLRVQLNDTVEDYAKENKYTVELEQKYNSLKAVTYALACAVVLCLAGWIFF